VWDERDPWPADREPAPKNAPRVIIVILFAVVLIATLVACCAAVGELLKLIGLEGPDYL
jgi:hypothetical protein